MVVIENIEQLPQLGVWEFEAQLGHGLGKLWRLDVAIATVINYSKLSSNAVDAHSTMLSN